MPWDDRLKIKVREFGRRAFPSFRSENDEERHDEERGEENIQYRLESSRLAQGKSIFGRCLGRFTADSSRAGIGIHINEHLAALLHWMFRVNFMFLFTVMCTIFFLLITIFAALIMAVGQMDYTCIQVGGTPFGNANSDFFDAFALSWTTFATVGYGHVYPAMSHQNDGNPRACVFITVVMALESLFGILYGGFCGAILFGKGAFWHANEAKPKE